MIHALSIMILVFLLYGGYLGCSRSEDRFHGMGSFILSYTIYCISFFAFMIMLLSFVSIFM